jgi:hypothetical protein
VAFSAQRQSENAYQEGLGGQDAFESGVGPQGATAEPVLRTIPKSYVGEDEAEEAFAEQQAEMKRAQEQFLPGSTGLPEVGFEPSEAQREEQVRLAGPGAELGPSEAELRQAAALAGQMALARQLAEAAIAEQEPEEEPAIVRTVESAQRAYAYGADVLGVVEALVFSESIIGALPGLFEVLVSSNVRLFIWAFKIRRGSLIRLIEPPALFPFEVTAIIISDLLLAMIFFVAVCLVLAICFIVYSLVTSIPGLPNIPGLSAVVSNAAH